jgi:carboxymethylenebutenolidase
MRRIAVLTAIAVCATMSAPAQEDWAKAKLEKSPRHGEWVKIKQGKREVESFITYPEVKDKATAVVVIHEIYGLSDWVRGVTDQLAEAGYIAISPDLLSGLGPKGGGTADLGGSEGARKVIGSLPPDQITADLNAVVDYVSKLPACNGKVVVMGFCWGGGQSFRFATNNKDLKAALVFYGTGPEAKDMQRIQCPVYGFYAGNDARVGATVPKTTEEMKQAGKTFDPVTYKGAGHGFMRAGEAPDASRENKKARDAAWEKVKGILKKI